MIEFATETHDLVLFFGDKDVADMRRVAAEWKNFGYEKIKETEENGNTIIIYAKRKEARISDQ